MLPHQPSHRRVALDAAQDVVLGLGEHWAFPKGLVLWAIA
jgi:hypothetical protein